MEANNIEVKEQVSASKKLSEADAKKLLKAATKLVVAKGKKVTEFSVVSGAKKEAVDAMLGPTGNLRAPTLVMGKILIVGFNEEVYQDQFL